MYQRISGKRLCKGPANLGLAYLTEENIKQLQSDSQCAELQLQRLLRDQIYLVVAKTHPLASQQEVDMTQLYGERLPRPSLCRTTPFWVRC